MVEPLVWERFEWRSGVDRYEFRIESGGLLGTLRAVAPDGSSAAPRLLSLPMVAWEGLLDSVKLSRKAREKPRANGLPPRAGSRWTAEEIAELEQGFRAGRKIPELALVHARTAVAIESQLEKLGLWQRPQDF